MELCLSCLFIAITLSPAHGFSNPKSKTWWSKRVASDSYHSAGRLSERQIKFAAEAGFKTLISLNTYDSHVGDELAVGGSYLPSTLKAKYISQDIAGVGLDIILDYGNNDWKNTETVGKVHALVRHSNKPVLFFCDDAYASTFLLLAHFANVTHHNDNQDGEPPMNSHDVFRVGALLGFHFGRDVGLRTLVGALTDTHVLTSYPEPDTASADWFKSYWLMKPMYGNIFIAGGLQLDNLPQIESAGIGTMINTRMGTTIPPDDKPSQEEVNLLNMKGRTGTYNESGRQSIQQLEANRLDPSRPTTYISQTATRNYEINNTLEFGDVIGYNETVERVMVKRVLPSMTYIHLPVGGRYKYNTEMWEAYNDILLDAEQKGPVLIQCGSGYRAGVVGIVTAAYAHCYNSSWAMRRSRDVGYDFITNKPSILIMLQEVLDRRNTCMPGRKYTSAATVTSVSYVTSRVIFLSCVISIVMSLNVMT